MLTLNGQMKNRTVLSDKGLPVMGNFKKGKAIIDL